MLAALSLQTWYSNFLPISVNFIPSPWGVWSKHPFTDTANKLCCCLTPPFTVTRTSNIWKSCCCLTPSFKSCCCLTPTFKSCCCLTPTFKSCCCLTPSFKSCCCLTPSFKSCCCLTPSFKSCCCLTPSFKSCCCLTPSFNVTRTSTRRSTGSKWWVGIQFGALSFQEKMRPCEVRITTVTTKEPKAHTSQ